MHPRLRQHVQRHLGAAEASSPALRRLFRDLDVDYRKTDHDRTSLQRALLLLADLTRSSVDGAPVDAVPAREGRRPAALPRLRRRLFERMPFAAIVCSPDLEVLDWNPAATLQYGYQREEAVGASLTTLLFAAADRGTVRRELRALLRNGEVDQSLRVASRQSGEARLDEWTVIPLAARSGRTLGAAILMREPFAAADRFAVAWQGTGDGLFDWDLRADRLWLSDAWRDMLGAPLTVGVPSDWLDRVHDQDREAVQAALAAHLEGRTARFESEHRLRHETGGHRWVLARASATRDAAGQAIRLCGSMMDVTERRAATDGEVREALHDPLTRLPNRSMFLDLIKRAFARTRRREGYAFAVLFLDLDHFKAINDGLGHAAGDELLVQATARLQMCLREGDSLARMGGDEFTVLVDDVKGLPDAMAVAERIQHATSQPYRLGEHEVFATVSIGIAISSPAYHRQEDLLLDADAAMYRAKAQGRARTAVFDAEVRERSPQLLDLEVDLRHALQRGEFRIHYLPIVDMASGHIQGLEALVRWAHPRRGLMSPAEFIPCAEETGLIVPIGRWLLQQAGKDIRRCRQASPSSEHLRLHVNLSSRQLLQGDLLQTIEQVVHEQHLDAADLALELTEHAMGNSAEVVQRMNQLSHLGVRLLMDDFGIPTSSLRSLHQYPVDSVKIDRSLLAGGAPRGGAPELIRTIVSMAREMGKPVVAEGVETLEQLGFLRELGCESAQGFLFSHPVDGDGAFSLVARGATW